MKIQAITSQHQKIQNLLSEADSFDADQIGLQVHWANYICVISSGFLENAIKEVYSKYSRSCSNKSVSNYVESNLPRIQNPKSLRFLKILSSFNK